MSIKILLDPGHFGKVNPYYVLRPAIDYSEAEMTWKLHQYLKAELESYGFEVGVTRTDPNKDLDVVLRGKMAKGYDLFLSLHSNACGTPSVNRAVMCCYQDLTGTDIDDKSKAIGITLGETIQKTMGLTGYQIYQRKISSDRDGDGELNDEYYGVLYGARLQKVPAVIVEHSFHTNPEAAKWLYNEANLKKLAENEAKALAEYYSLNKRLIGDVNNDRETNSLDASLILKYDAGLINLNDEDLKAGDVNQDGETNSLDASLILKHDAGLIDITEQKPKEEAKKEEPKDNSYMVMVTVAALNIRSGPSAKCKVVGVAKKNEKYKILEEKNGWGRHDKGWFGLSYTKKV